VQATPAKKGKGAAHTLFNTALVSKERGELKHYGGRPPPDRRRGTSQTILEAPAGVIASEPCPIRKKKQPP